MSNLKIKYKRELRFKCDKCYQALEVKIEQEGMFFIDFTVKPHECKGEIRPPIGSVPGDGYQPDHGNIDSDNPPQGGSGLTRPIKKPDPKADYSFLGK